MGAGKLQVQRNRQIERIHYDEKNAARIRSNRLAHEADLNSDWVENLEPTRKTALFKQSRSDIKSELVYANRALLRVRRAELTELLATEEAELTKRLAGECGMVKYRDRN